MTRGIVVDGRWSIVGFVAVCAFARGLAAQPDSEPLVGVVASGPQDEPARAHLQRILGHSLRVYSVALAQDREALIDRARARGDRAVVILDSAGRRVEVVRTEDAMAVQRKLPAGSARSPYAVAFVAAELLHLIERLPPERAAAPTPAPAASMGSAQGAVRWGLLLSLAGELRANSELSFLRPALDAGATLRFSGRPLWLALVARASPFGSDSLRVGGETLELEQSDFALGIGAGLRHRALSVLGLLRGGASLASWSLRPSERWRSQFRGWLGAALQGRLKVWSSFGLFAEIGGALSPLRTRYLDPPQELLSPGRFDLVALIGLSWDSG